MNMRDEFESQFSGQYGMAVDELNQYVNADTAAAWDGFQVGRGKGAESAAGKCDAPVGWISPGRFESEMQSKMGFWKQLKAAQGRILELEAALKDAQPQSAGLPAKIEIDKWDATKTKVWQKGWNAAIDAMLTTTPQPAGAWVPRRDCCPSTKSWENCPLHGPQPPREQGGE